MKRRGDTGHEPLRVEIRSSLEEFRGMKAIWNRVVQEEQPYFPFLCHEWFLLWMEHFLKDEDLAILCVADGSDVVAIAPFVRRREVFKGLNVNKMELIGNVYSPIRTILVDRRWGEKRGRIFTAVLEFLFDLYGQWDVLDLFPLPTEDGTIESLLEACAGIGCGTVLYDSVTNWYTSNFNGSGTDYMNSRSKRLRKNVRKRTKLLEDSGDLRLRLIREEADLDVCMEWYYRVYGKSWKKEERVGPTYHRDLATLSARKGWLRLGFLLLNDQPIATKFMIVHKGVAYLEKSAFIEAFSEFGPGSILTGKMLEHVINRDGVRQIDYGHGDEDHKKQWVEARRIRKRIVVFNKSLQGRLSGIMTTRVLPLFQQTPALRRVKEYMSGKVKG